MYSVLNGRVCTAHRNGLLGFALLLILAGPDRGLADAAGLVRQDGRMGKSSAGSARMARQIEQHAACKQRVLMLLNETPRLEMTRRFSGDSRDTWRRVLIDGPFGGIDKGQFLEAALSSFADRGQELPKALEALRRSHSGLFGSGRNRNLMIRHAGDPAFTPFGVHMSLAGAIGTISAGNDEPVQAFHTIFETGQNTRGYVHKLECHAGAVEFIYAVTDIVYGVMLPGELRYGPDRVVAEPAKVQMFYVNAGEVIALHPYVLHSGSLSVEPDRSFSIMIYKKPVETGDLVVPLPDAWRDWEKSLKLPEIDKYYLTLEQLHTAELKDNRGFIAAARPLRLPVWK
ncbi:MAG TPA: hypothetical protein ENI81_13140 [Phycisphaerales bacterium]|nr:hypothetical protein [Phycisphaerales bacterium]